MLVAYYSKSRKDEFKEIFDNLKISEKNKNISENNETDFKSNATDSKNNQNEFSKKNSEYENTMGNYHTIYINFSLLHNKNGNIYDYLSKLGKEIIYDIEKIINNKSIINEVNKRMEKYDDDIYRLIRFLSFLHPLTEEEFVFIIDEWDYIFDHNLYSVEERDFF